jgi:hypothetical protein
VAPPNGRIEQPLDAAAGQLERPIAGKGRRPCRDEHQKDADAQVGRRHKAAADRRPADDRRQRQQRQCRRGRQLRAGRGRERRRRLAGVDPGPAQHLHGERRGRARQKRPTALPASWAQATANQRLVPSAIRSSFHKHT